MAKQLIAPRMGEGVEELTLVKWLKKEGDKIKELEPIVELETDKVATEIPSPASGTILKLIAVEGSQVKVGDVLAWIGEPGEELIAPAPKAPSKIKETPQELAPAASAENKTNPDDGFISPIVKKIAEENKVDLTKIKGTGLDGRITKSDILAFLEKHGPSAPSAETQLSDSIDTVPTGSVSPQMIPISNIRRTIAERMVESLRTSPHVLSVMEADLSHVITHRAHNKPLYEQDGVNLTLTAYFIAAIAVGLKKNPLVNSSWTEGGMQIHPEINIGMAVSLGSEGLIVPVIRNTDTLSLLGIARQVNDLASRARAKKLQPSEVKGGTFSLTNHGQGGSLFAFPIITQPQVGILGTGLMQKRAVVVTDDQSNDSIAIRPMIYLSFVFDHRVLDGEGADSFLGDVKKALENWIN